MVINAFCDTINKIPQKANLLPHNMYLDMIREIETTVNQLHQRPNTLFSWSK